MENKPKWLNKEVPTRKKSDKQEKRLAKTFGGKTTAGSGSVFSENDVKTPLFDIEAKTTQSKQFILKLSDLKKMENRSKFTKTPLFIIEFADDKSEYVVIRATEFLNLLQLDGLINST